MDTHLLNDAMPATPNATSNDTSQALLDARQDLHDFAALAGTIENANVPTDVVRSLGHVLDYFKVETVVQSWVWGERGDTVFAGKTTLTKGGRGARSRWMRHDA